MHVPSTSIVIFTSTVNCNRLSFECLCFWAKENTPQADAVVYSDRFIPSRAGSKLDQSAALHDNALGTPAASTPNAAGQAASDAGSDGSAFSILLRSGLLGQSDGSEGSDGTEARQQPQDSSRDDDDQLLDVTRGLSGLTVSSAAAAVASVTTPGSAGSGASSVSAGSRPPSNTGSTGRRTFRFKAAASPAAVRESPYSLSLVDDSAKGLVRAPRSAPRKIAKAPYKVLDAPTLEDDFYLNLVSWSSQNMLAVGLGSCVYLWSGFTAKVTKLCDLCDEPSPNSDVGDSVTSVSWSPNGTYCCVGTKAGEVQIWDSIACKRVRTFTGHLARVGALAWNREHMLASGSRDRSILIRDDRASSRQVGRLAGHKQEVCGLKWSFDDRQLASGGNDNKLLIWSAASSQPMHTFAAHTAAVKAIAWSPHQSGLLASGGGTADRCIRFWNTQTGSPLQCVDTGSQVCNLTWSTTVNEIVSTHGYSLNQIMVWKYPTMQTLATLTGHTYRVLYLALSPDGQTIVTGAGDETLRFWNVFPSTKTGGGAMSFQKSQDIR